MRVIVPLAGPDFVLANGKVKAVLDLDGEPLLKKALESRPWAGSVDPAKYVFVMLDRPETRRFAQSELADWYRQSQVVFLSQPTRGAAFSALAGVSSYTNIDEPFVIDLADILYSSSLAPHKVFADSPDCGGIALTFHSDAPEYSYLRCDADGRFVEAAEKQVISSQASAGTYIFANATVFLRAVAHAIENEATQARGGLFYVCPLFNGVRAQGRNVSLSPVTEVVDIKLR